MAGPDFESSLKPEVEAWIARLKERGRSASVYLSGTGDLVDPTPRQMVRLLDAVISTEIRPASFLYALEALLMSPRTRWQVPKLRNYMESLADPETPSSIDVTLAIALRKKISAEFLGKR